MIYWDNGKTLSYNCLFNFIIGPRGPGKSYCTKKTVIKRFKDKGQQFTYLRRFADELETSAETYFDDIVKNNEFPDDVIEYRNGTYFINDEPAGYAHALTKAKDYKSIAYPSVWTIIFEEFLIEEGGYTHYLKNEVRKFLNYYMSIDRYRGTQVFFLANSEDLVNPYFLYWDLSLPYGSNFLRKGDILLEMVDVPGFADERKNTRFGKLIEGTEFADYAIDNKFTRNTNTFIRKKSEKATYYFTIAYGGVNYGVWIDNIEGVYFISENVDPYCKLIYSFTNEDHKPNMLLLPRASRSPYVKALIDGYKAGIVYFESQKLKGIVFDIIKMCLR